MFDARVIVGRPLIVSKYMLLDFKPLICRHALGKLVTYNLQAVCRRVNTLCKGIEFEGLIEGQMPYQVQVLRGHVRL